MRVLFCGWFSTAYHLINLIKQGAKEDGLNIEVIGTHHTSFMVYQQVCDEFYVTPAKVEEDAYVDWCLELCKKQHIDVVFPKRHLMFFAKRKAEFENLGIKVLVEDDYNLLALLEDKVKTAKFLNGHTEICEVAPIRVVNNVEEFKAAYQELKEITNGDTLCFKYAIGEGGTSYRKISDKPFTIKCLDFPQWLTVTYDQALEILGSVEQFKDLLVMPYLDGTEISIDCLNTKAGFIAIARYKIDGRLKKVSLEEDLIQRAKAFAELTRLKHPFNLQFRYHHGVLHLLEVNTRMSGGCYISCLSGANIPYLALRNLLDLPIKLPNKLKEIESVHIETPVIVSQGG